MVVLFKVGLETCLFGLVLEMEAIERLLAGMYGSDFLFMVTGGGSWDFLGAGLCLSEILT